MTIQSNNENRAQADGMLAGYLAVLTASLPAGEREMFEEEARNHLREHAAAYEEIGHEPVEAMSTAIEKFGVPMRLARALTVEVAEPELPPPGRQLASIHGWGATASASAMLLANAMISILHLGWHFRDDLLLAAALVMGGFAAEFVTKTHMTLLKASLLTGAIYAALAMNLEQLLGDRVSQALFIPYGLAGIATAVSVNWVNQYLDKQRNSHAERA